MNKEVRNIVQHHQVGGYDVLIVEDNEEQAYLIQLLIEENGLTADYVTKSREALKKVKSDRPQVVILDLMMPELDGFRLCKEIKSSQDMEQTRIIVYSGRMYESDRRKAFELGADAFFIKPTRANLLITKIRELIHPVHHESYQN